MKKVLISIIILSVVIVVGIFSFQICDVSIPEEIITSKNEEEESTFNNRFYSNMNEYEFEKINESIKYKKCFSYEEKITNKLFVTIYNKSEYFFNSVDVYAVYYDKDNIIYIEKENVYGILTPRNKYIVDLGFVPSKTTKHEIFIIPSDKYEKYKDMSDFIKADIVKKNQDYYCKIENKSGLNIDYCYIQMIFYDKYNNIIDIKTEGFYDINSKKTQKEELYSLRDFDHYETIINAYYYD